MNEFYEVWIFQGENGRFPSGVFSSKSKAEDWISEHGLSGILTKYVIDTGVYEWAVEKKYFNPQKDSEKSPEFIQSFSSASQEHFHYENGKLD
ncbi:MAG: hypothetical protein OEZ34_02745 [Spirochaetia bacterium]|nr:hypothetical protein [Spirochaetia bacterium]